MRTRHLTLGVATAMAMSWTMVAAPVSAALPTELPVFDVVKAGLTSDEADRLSRAFGVEAKFADGSVRYVGRSFGDVPMKPETVIGKDEDGRRTVASSFDLAAIREIKALSDADALAIVEEGFGKADVQLPEGAKADVGHTMLKVKPRRGDGFEAQVATSVRYRLSLAGLPLSGPGADIGVTLDPQGGITDVREAAFIVQQGETMRLIGAEAAKAECAQRSPRGSKITLGLQYYAPPVSGDVKTILPYYQCRGQAGGGATLIQALVPAIAETQPRISISARVVDARTGRVDAVVRIAGGRRPYHVQWLSTNGVVPQGQATRRSMRYHLQGGGRSRAEHLMVMVTDANGVAAQATTALAVPRGLGAGPRPGATAVTPASLAVLDVGAEFNVTNWQCVQQSAAGFQSEFSSRGYPIAFRWLAPSAWERDFRDTVTKAGDDASYVDNVDLAWYTGHGSPGSFTFDNNTHDDGSIVPTDARWGDRDLEWLQLESCNVLQFTDGAGTPIWSRWSQVFDGLHLLNGFQTTAACVTVGGGTAGAFSSWLLGKNFGFFTFPALRVRQAWAMMALSLEPPGRQYVTMGVFGAGGVTDYDDFFWGKGPVGPDIPKSQITGYWWLVGTV